MKTVVCIASGPSLTKEQCDLVREVSHLVYVICVNDSYLMYPECDMLFAADRKWWKLKLDRILSTVKTRNFFCLKGHNINKNLIKEIDHSKNIDLMSDTCLFHGSNSGQMAINIAFNMKADKIILIGYDFKKTDKAHFFGDHERGLLNATNIPQWLENLEPFIKKIEDKVNIVNCSNDTAINIIRRSNLEIELDSCIQR